MPELNWQKTWSAPAKLNLCLHILGQREDGYHELETIFQLVDLCDFLKFTPRHDDKIVRIGGLQEVEPESDLVVRAAQLLKSHVKHPVCGVDIAYQKNIPTQAGLGGGSSNAATTLVCLNQLWECGLTQQELIKLGADLGADVPVFIHGYSSYAHGIGEKLESIKLPERQYLIIKPAIDISTAKIFQDKRLTRDTSAVTIRGLLEPMQANSQVLTGHNDCEKLVCEEYPEISQLIDFLKQFGESRLTGTGSSVFMVCAESTNIDRIQQELSEKSFARDCRTYVVKGLNRSPLLDDLQCSSLI